jgi:hypothetical protein
LDNSSSIGNQIDDCIPIDDPVDDSLGLEENMPILFCPFIELNSPWKE